MFKPRGKTFKEAAYDISTQASGVSGSAGLSDIPAMGPGANVGSIDLGAASAPRYRNRPAPVWMQALRIA